MQINARCRFHYTPQFHKARSHHHEISQHVAFTEECPECLKAIGNFSPRRYDLRVNGFALPVPCPGIRKGLNLACGFAFVFFREEDVVIGIGIERRVQINEVDGFVFDMQTHHVQIIAIIEQVLCAFRHKVITSPRIL